MTQTYEPAAHSQAAGDTPGGVPGGYAYGAPPGMIAVPAYAIRQEDRFSRLMMRLWTRSPRWSSPLAVLLCFAGGVAYTLATHPTSSDAASMPNCVIKLATGFDCPGCGGTRAFYYLLHGNVIAAARSHLILVFAAPYLAYMYVAWAANTAFRWRMPMLRPSAKTVSTFLIVWLVFSVLRNLPWAPFTWFYV
jgi:hypothetical protein